MRQLLYEQLNSMLDQYAMPEFLWHLMQVVSHRRNQAVQADQPVAFGQRTNTKPGDLCALPAEDCAQFLEELRLLHNKVVKWQVVLMPQPDKAGVTYTLSEGSITCTLCGMTSHNPNDVLMRYCARCNWMHEHHRHRTLEDINKFHRLFPSSEDPLHGSS